jgi:hypothetical protein
VSRALYYHLAFADVIKGLRHRAAERPAYLTAGGLCQQHVKGYKEMSNLDEHVEYR